ncbi:hypothetical protein ACFL0B_08755, partial [Thermodesulfobacteriota bacterium]
SLVKKERREEGEGSELVYWGLILVIELFQVIELRGQGFEESRFQGLFFVSMALISAISIFSTSLILSRREFWSSSFRYLRSPESKVCVSS